MKLLFPIFIFATLIEIYTIIKVGEVIGGFSTILLIILTAGIGSFLLKQQGLSTLNNAKMQIQQGRAPAFEMLEGVVIMISGVLLLTPGFITDGIGLLGLLPFSRKAMINYFISKKNIRKYQKTKNNTIEGEILE